MDSSTPTTRAGLVEEAGDSGVGNAISSETPTAEVAESAARRGAEPVLACGVALLAGLGGLGVLGVL